MDAAEVSMSAGNAAKMAATGSNGGAGAGGGGSAAVSSAPMSRAEEVATILEQNRATLTRAMRVLVRMVRDRGYTITEIGGRGPDADASAAGLAAFDDEARCTVAEANQEVLIMGQIENTATINTNTPVAAEGLPIYTGIAVVIVNKGAVQTVRDVMTRIRDTMPAVACVIMVSRAKPTSFTHKFLDAQRAPRVDFFHLPDIQQVVVDHCLVPPHVVLSPEQAARVRARYAGGTMPRLRTTDAPVKYLGIRPGAIVSVQERWGRSPLRTTFFTVEEPPK
jgi:DNA-directed RNA polymerase subunit H (RpoH/RPB5)